MANCYIKEYYKSFLIKYLMNKKGYRSTVPIAFLISLLSFFLVKFYSLPYKG